MTLLPACLISLDENIYEEEHLANRIKFSLIFYLLIALPAESSEETILGFWLTSDSIVEIKICAQNICAQIEHVFVAEDEDPLSILDINNLDEELKKRTLIGVNLFDGFKENQKSDRALKGGRIYNPRDGKFYKSKLKLLDNGNLVVEGCILFLCDGEEWQPLEVTLNPDGSHQATPKNP